MWITLQERTIWINFVNIFMNIVIFYIYIPVLTMICGLGHDKTYKMEYP